MALYAFRAERTASTLFVRHTCGVCGETDEQALPETAYGSYGTIKLPGDWYTLSSADSGQVVVCDRNHSDGELRSALNAHRARVARDLEKAATAEATAP